MPVGGVAPRMSVQASDAEGLGGLPILFGGTFGVETLYMLLCTLSSHPLTQMHAQGPENVSV